MYNNLFILKSFNLYFKHKPFRLILLFTMTLFLGFTQGIGIVLLIPLLQLLAPEGSEVVSNKLTRIFESILEHTGLEISFELVLIVFSVTLVTMAFLNYFKSIIQASYQQEFSYITRKRIFKKILTSDWQFLNGKSKHSHIQILTSEIPKMTSYYYNYVGLATKIIFIIAYGVLALLVSVKFTLLIVVIGFVVMLVLRKYIHRAETLGGENIRAFRKTLKHIDDFWLTVKMAKVHNSEVFYYDKFDKSSTLMLQYQFNQIKNRAFPQFLFTIAGVFALVLIVYLAYNVAQLPLVSIFVLILLFGRIFPQFKGINNDVNMLYSNVPSVKMVLKLDNEIKESAFKVTDVKTTIPFEKQLEIKNLNFSYDVDTPIFTNFSTLIPAHKITGIIGESGSGKTTLIDIITGLQDVPKGTITVDGLPLTKDQLPTWKSEIGYLPQDSFFIDGTIRENLVWDSKQNPTDSEIMEVLKQVNAYAVVENQKKGLDTSIANYQYHFSGGERQRLALARVLLRKPKLLLLDEATSALDPQNEEQIMKCLFQLKEKHTIVFITHRESLKPSFDVIIDLNK
ncbi:MAG: hypothetical protein COA67_12445 [Lutibacter sp.]|nr:MAG: hypothetical protein COA67_12445 [Lutibacter sp.]